MRRRAPVAVGALLLAAIPIVAFLGTLGSGESHSPTDRQIPAEETEPTAGLTPLVDSREELAQDPRPAVQLLARTMGQPVANATVASVEEMTYAEAMCGLASYTVPDPDLRVWVVAIDGIWQPFPYPRPPGTSPPGPERAVRAFVVNSETGISLQTFSPWPLPRDPKFNCTR